MSALNLIGYAYLLVSTLMSVLCFLVYGFDKRRARLNGPRVPESKLHVLAWLGGWPGALIGSWFFRHKTQKPLFVLTTVAIIGFHSILIGSWIWLRSRHS